MSSSQATRGEIVELTAHNIGGIDETTVTFSPGVTILAGRNATNRTSLLQAIMAALGSDDVSLKGDSEEGAVELSIGDQTYSRTLERGDGMIRTSGDPYLSDPTLADLFAFLLESNEARRAVATDDDLRDLIMRPVDTDEIQAEIDRLLEARREVEQELDEIDALKDKLPALEEERQRIESEIDSKADTLAETEAELDERDATVEEPTGDNTELEERLAELRDARSSLEDVRYDLETEQESLSALTSERADLQAERDDLPEAPTGEIEDIEAQIDRLRSRKQQLESAVTELQSVIRFNEDRLSEAEEDLLGQLDDSADGSPTDELLAGEATTCWTCGSEVDTDQIEETIESLRSLSQEKLREVNEIDDELQSLKEDREELRKQQERREQIDQRLDRLSSEIQETEANIERLTDRRDALREEVGDIEAEVEKLEDDAHETVLELHKEANELEYKLGRLESERDRVADNIATIEERIATESDLHARREELTDEIESLRTKIERIERQAIDEFNDTMDTVLQLLDYRNLERVWLERTEREVSEGRRRSTKYVFDLHVVRRTDSGTSYEDTVDHLSESEREVVGLVFALAGYLAHEVHETVPFVLLDSLEAIDAERIATLVEYIADYCDYLVVALLSEDAAALEDDYDRIREI